MGDTCQPDEQGGELEGSGCDICEGVEHGDSVILATRLLRTSVELPSDPGPGNTVTCQT